MSEPKINFLVPIGFSPQSEIILEQACNLAKYYDASITVLYVLDLSRTTGLFSSLVEEDQLKVNAEKKLSQLIERFKKEYNLIIGSLLVEGRTYETIVLTAKSVHADFIIMGAAGATGLKGQLIGSNTMRTIKQAHCPVITIRGVQHRHGCKNIVLPLDLTKDTTQKIEYAIEFAKLFGDSVVRIVSVIWDNDKDVITTLTEQIINAQEVVHTAGVECTAEFVRVIKKGNSFTQTIIDYANKVDGDLIMIMTQQEKNPTELFMGSSAQSIISKSDVPVMNVIPRGINKLQIF
jgi:nucleotide-binding universal stress UspA family protein